MTTPGAAAEQLPRAIPEGVRGALASVANLGVAYVGWKYRAPEHTHGAELAVTATLVALREALAGRAYLFERFSYADVTMAVVLQFIRPVDHPAVPLGPATRAAVTHEALARPFADLLTWRDDLYAKHRAPRA